MYQHLQNKNSYVKSTIICLKSAFIWRSAINAVDVDALLVHLMYNINQMQAFFI
jgi:hypothetical protein